MNISQLSNLSFQATILGSSYKKIKDMSINNGLSVKEAQEAENRMHNTFPDDTIEINSHYKSGITTLGITLKRNNKSNSFMNLRFNRTFDIETQNDEQVKNLFLVLIEKIEDVGKQYAEATRKYYQRKNNAAS